MSEQSPYRPGEDAKVIADISKNIYGDFETMFEAHNWPERGSDMMRKVQSRVAQTYGSVRNFDIIHRQDNPFEGDPSVMITSFWGYDPESWGCVGFTKEGRRNTIIAQTTDPFIMVVYVTEKASSTTLDYMLGRVVGFYEITHVTGMKEDFLPDWQFNRSAPEKWRYSLKASRAWMILPEYMPHIREFDPTMHEEGRERSVSANAEMLRPELITQLKRLPRKEMPVYGGARPIDSAITVPSNNMKNYVRGGAARLKGYDVGEPKHTEKELYILQLCGDETAFLGEDVQGKKIIKVGLSISPQTRREAFQKALPKGAYSWDVIRTTLKDGDDHYPNFATAEAGEMAMKKHLGLAEGAWLGGEFYLADDEEISRAWRIGRDAALDKLKTTKR